jgi:predicted DNA-binding protein (UPF0251 family)
LEQWPIIRLMAKKGRSASGARHGAALHPERTPRGERSGQAKLTDAKVREMRLIYAVTDISIRQIGLRFGVSWWTAWSVVNRATWKHVE